MKRKAPSPTPSEHEVDIASALFAEESDDDTPRTTRAPAVDLDFGDLLKVGDDSNDEDGDAEFIASTQRSSNRKASNLQGKTVKKGGGFQAMGSFLQPPLPTNLC